MRNKVTVVRSRRWTVVLPVKIQIVSTVTAPSRDKAIDAAIKNARKGRGRVSVLKAFDPQVEIKENTVSD